MEISLSAVFSSFSVVIGKESEGGKYYFNTPRLAAGRIFIYHDGYPDKAMPLAFQFG